MTNPFKWQKPPVQPQNIPRHNSLDYCSNSEPESLSLAWERNAFHINNVCKTNKFLRRTSFCVLVHSKRFEDVVFAENALVKDGGSNLSISVDTCYFSGPVVEEVP